ncbi:MAG: YfcE family phosphodiesterase [Clostridia bacterium]|nr:YfcE family phosphodiesterase [Clostridia bacterium]
MEALIFSDSHGHAERIEEILLRQVRRLDAVLFAGDGLRDLDRAGLGDQNVYAVLGNCDWFSPDPHMQTEQIISFGGFNILLTHGHLYNVKHGYGALLVHAAKIGADIVIFGHTHVPHLETISQGSEVGGVVLERPLYLFNPGSLGADGSFGTLTVRNGQILLAHGRLET